MKSLIVLLALTLLFGSASFGQEPAWKEFVSEKLNFSVRFPGDPTEKRGKTPKLGDDWYAYVVSGGGRNFTVRVDELGKGYTNISDAGLSSVYEHARQRSLSGLKGSKLISDTEVRVDGRLGREVRVANDNVFFVYRVFAADDRYYQITYAVRKSVENESMLNETLKTFLDSFRFLK